MAAGLFRVLIIDQHLQDQTLIAETLKKSLPSSRISFAAGVAAARTILTRAVIDLVIFDLEIDGSLEFELIRWVRQTPQRPPLVILSRAAATATVVKAIKSGAYDYLVKDEQRTYLSALPPLVTRLMTPADDTITIEEKAYRAVVEDQTELISRFTPDDYRLTFVNDAFCRFYGYKRHELLGKPATILIPPNEHNNFAQRMKKLTRDQWVQTVEHYNILPDGTERWTQWTERALFDAEGVVREIQTVGRDMTAYKQAERASRENEERLRSLLRHLPDTIYTHDFVSGETRFYQDTFLGYSHEDLIRPGSILHALDPQFIPAVSTLWYKLPTWNEGTLPTLEYRIRNKQGEWEWVQERKVCSEPKKLDTK